MTAGVTAPVGTVGDSYDNAFAETVNGLYKAELVHSKRVGESAEAVELAALGCRTPVEVEAVDHCQQDAAPVAS